VARDVSQVERSDRRLWLDQRCPSCRAEAGSRCRAPARRKPPATLSFHAARGWRQRPCPACKAKAGEPCFTPRGRHVAAPHTARLAPARGELHASDDAWRALERAGAEIALVRFCGGGGRHGTLESVSIHAGGRELTHWSTAPGSELAGALTAPAWARYGSFRGQPPITATLQWNLADRSLLLAGTRGREPFEETLKAAELTNSPPAARHVAPHERASTADTTDESSRAAGRRWPADTHHRPGVLPLRPADPAKRTTRSPLLQQALPPGRLPRQAPRTPPRTRTSRALRLVRELNAHRTAGRSALLQQAMPTGRLARQARAQAPTRPLSDAARVPTASAPRGSPRRPTAPPPCASQHR